jgi:5-dehydro-2-deoxygluconokinase
MARLPAADARALARTDYGGLSEWPRDQVVKVLCFCHPADDNDMWSAQEAVVQRLFHAARRNRLEFLLEVIASKVGSVRDDTTALIIQRFYNLGVYPDWWKLEPLKRPRRGGGTPSKRLNATIRALAA